MTELKPRSASGRPRLFNVWRPLESMQFASKRAPLRARPRAM
jgi:hypothetical protein